MATPSRPLELNFDLDDITLDEWEAFEQFRVSAFRAFMVKYSNWTSEEVGQLTRRDLRVVIDQLLERIRESATPKATGGS